MDRAFPIYILYKRGEFSQFSFHIFSFTMQSFEREEKANGGIQFVLKESTKYVKGQYAIKLSFYKGKVYLHIQGK